MTMNRVLIDTSFLIALTVAKDQNHEAARAVGMAFKGVTLVPEVVLNELFHVIHKEASHAHAVKLLAAVHHSPIRRIALLDDDLTRMESIFETYIDHEFDFTDTAVMALCERLNITTIFTFSRNSFSIFKPTHCNTLTLLP